MSESLPIAMVLKSLASVVQLAATMTIQNPVTTRIVWRSMIRIGRIGTVELALVAMISLRTLT